MTHAAVKPSNRVSLPMKNGVITRVTPNGLAYLIDSATGQPYTFMFGKIAGYKGESAKQ